MAIHNVMGLKLSYPGYADFCVPFKKFWEKMSKKKTKLPVCGTFFLLGVFA